MGFQAFADESGTKGASASFVIAALMNDAADWADFSDEWQRCLDDSPRIEYFKMQEAAARSGQFNGWPSKKVAAKIRALVPIIKRRKPRAIHCTFDLAGFDERMAPQVAKPMSNPYFFAFYSIIAGVCYDLYDLNQHEGVEIIFDENVIFGLRAKRWYPAIKEAVEPELRDILPPEPLFRNDREYLPLQAADMLAWLFRRTSSGQRTEFEWIATKLAPSVKMSRYSSIFDRERMTRCATLSYKKKFPPDLIQRWRKMLGEE